MWSLDLTELELKKGHSRISSLIYKDFFCINMGGKVANNDWGESNWRLLIDKLSLSYTKLSLVIIGSTSDFNRGNNILNRWPNGGINFCGLLEPRETASVLCLAKFFIGHDSGPLHLAAAMQVPCVGLFGNNDPAKKWHPYGLNHYTIHKINGMKEIKVDEVLNAIKYIGF